MGFSLKKALGLIGAAIIPGGGAAFLGMGAGSTLAGLATAGAGYAAGSAIGGVAEGLLGPGKAPSVGGGTPGFNPNVSRSQVYNQGVLQTERKVIPDPENPGAYKEVIENIESPEAKARRLSADKIVNDTLAEIANPPAEQEAQITKESDAYLAELNKDLQERLTNALGLVNAEYAARGLAPDQALAETQKRFGEIGASNIRQNQAFRQNLRTTRDQARYAKIAAAQSGISPDVASAQYNTNVANAMFNFQEQNRLAREQQQAALAAEERANRLARRGQNIGGATALALLGAKYAYG